MNPSIWIPFLLLLAQTVFSGYIDAVTTLSPYRAGQINLGNSNGTYTVTFPIVYDSSLKIQKPAIGICDLSYENTGTNRINFSFDLNDYKPTNLTSFNVFVKILSPAYYSTTIRLRYFVTTTTDQRMITTYLENNDNTVQEYGSSSSGATVTKTQPIFNPYLTSTNCIGDFGLVTGLLCVVDQTLNSLVVGLLGGLGLGQAIYQGNTAYIPYTTLKIICLINKLDATVPSSGGWKFKVESNSNSLSNLKINATYSSSITSIAYNCSVILINSSMPSYPSTYMKYGSKSLPSNQAPYQDPLLQNQTSIYYLTGIYDLDIKNTSRISFTFSPTSSSLYTWSYNPAFEFWTYSFNILGFFVTSCFDESFPYLLLQTQKCYSDCPNGYYQDTYYCSLCALPTYCLTCDIISTNCTSCDPSSKTILVDNECIPCQSNEYYDSSTFTCKPCPAGCVTCTSSTVCTSCRVDLLLALVGGNCVSCSTGFFFSPLNTCVACPSNCTACTDLDTCQSCDSSNHYYLNGTSCPKCDEAGTFFNAPTLECKQCMWGCVECVEYSTCISCNATMLTVLVMGVCEYCPDGTYYSGGVCVTCPLPCSTCESSTHCTACHAAYTLVSNQCLDCSDPLFIPYCPPSAVVCLTPNTYYTSARKCQYIFQMTSTVTQNRNELIICSSFNATIDQLTQISQNYTVELNINDQTILFTSDNVTIPSQNPQLCFNYPFNSSFTNSPFHLQFQSTGDTSSIINPSYSSTVTGAHLKDVETDMLRVVQQMFNYIEDNSGIGMSALILTSGLSFFIGLIEFIEITSLYLYLRIEIPYNYHVMLKSIMDFQGFSLLPFDIPNPMESNPLIVTGDQVYQDNDFDLYFMRTNLIPLIQALIYVLFYTGLYYALRSIKSKNMIAKFFVHRGVKRYFTNCAVTFESLQIVLVFSAAAALTSLHLNVFQSLSNYFTANLFLLIPLTIFSYNMITLVQSKNKKQIDTKELYPIVQRNRAGAEMYTLFRGMGLLLIAMAIPLLHVLCVVLIAVIFLTIQLYYIVNRKLFKFRALKYLRIIHTVSFLLFNAIYVVYYLIQEYLQDIDVEIKLRLGNVSMGLLLLIYLLDLVQLVIDMVDETLEKIMSVCPKKKHITTRQTTTLSVIQTQEYNPKLDSGKTIYAKRRVQKSSEIQTKPKRREGVRLTHKAKIKSVTFTNLKDKSEDCISYDGKLVEDESATTEPIKRHRRGLSKKFASSKKSLYGQSF